MNQTKKTRFLFNPLNILLAIVPILAFVMWPAAAPSLNAAPPKTKVDTPTITCAGSGNDYIDIQVCAGATGAPAGFTIQWKTAADFALNGWAPTNADGSPNSYCDASFSGNASLSRYNLGANQCVTVRIGELLMDSGVSTTCPVPLLICTDYVFRVFAHASPPLQVSDKSANLTCKTACPTGCDPAVKSFGFWKTHYPDAWPAGADGMTVGCQTYSADQLESILLATPAGGNALVALAHQVINTRLNILNGASAAYIADTAVALAAAEALMCTTGAVPPVGAGSLTADQASSLTKLLDGIRGQYECP